MKKHVFSSDKYKWLTGKNSKQFVPNLPSTDITNNHAYEKMEHANYLEIEKLSLVKSNYVEHDHKKKLSVIVPYRDRKSHLHEFVSKIPGVLDKQNIDYKITIIEQDDKKQFNKGTLNNIGFLETKDHDYFCFHDVDMLPIKADYGYSNKNMSEFGIAIHVAKYVEQFGFEELPGYFGGVVLIDKLAFELINGYSISYWGWGIEDDDFHRRCYSNSRIVTIYRNGVYKSLPHKHNFNENVYSKNFATYTKNIHTRNDGVLQTKYKVLSKDILTDKISIIKVAI